MQLKHNLVTARDVRRKITVAGFNPCGLDIGIRCLANRITGRKPLGECDRKDLFRLL